LDYVLSNSENFKVTKEYSDLSDHYVITLETYDFKKSKEKNCYINASNWNFNNVEANNYLHRMLGDLPDLTNLSSSEIDYGIRAGLTKTYCKFVKTRRLKIRNSNEVTSVKITRLKNRRDRFKKCWSRNKTAENYVRLVRACRSLNTEVRRVRKSIICSKLNKDPKSFWGEVNKLRGIVNKSIDTIKVNGQQCTSLKKISDAFVDFFTGKVDKLLGDYEPFSPVEIMGNDPEWTPFSEMEIRKAFERLSNKKSSGMDSLSGYFLKIFKETLIPHLAVLFNKILSTNIIPPTWKIARIMPVHKKGEVDEISNYRPVSNLVTLAKIFEICILQRLETLDLDYVPGPNQHGFRKKHGTNTALAEVIHLITDGLDNKKMVGIYSADLTAAFDLLRKEKLVEIMFKKGVPAYLIKIIHAYLENRTGYVQIDEAKLWVKDIKAGCVQGSVIGPFLFNLYMSDLNDIISPCKLVSYADDSYVIVHENDIESLKSTLTNKIKQHCEWLREMGMISNMEKTEMMIFDPEEIQIGFGGKIIKSTKTMKVLGVLLDNQLNWVPFVQKVIGKVRSNIFALRYIRRYLSLKDTVKVVRSQVISRLSYGSPVWSSSLSYILRARIRSVYFLVIRMIIRDFNLRLSRKRMLRITGLENIDDIFFRRTSVFLYNIIYSLEPTNLAGIILSKSYFNERHQGKLTFFDSSRTKMGKKCITNLIKSYSDNWEFDWLGISVHEFKRKLRSQFDSRLFP